MRPSAEHQQAVARRLEALRADLAAYAADPGPPGSAAVGLPAELPAERPAEPLSAQSPGPPAEPAPAWWAGHTRLAGERLPPPAAPPTDHPAPALPEPGRHAARRSWGLLPDAMRIRWTPSGASVAVVALLVIIGAGFAFWQLHRARPQPEAAPSSITGRSVGSSVPSPASASIPTAAPGATAGGAKVTVDVAGRVRRPGIAVLPEGSRVIDAIRAAGGARRGVDLTALNLARVLVDGEQILVGQTAAPIGAGTTTPGAAPGPGQLVNLNSATQEQLESLPEIGPVTAQSILAWRTEHGAFTSIEELMEVDGIGPATLKQITPWVTL